MFSYHVDRHDFLVSWTRSSPGPPPGISAKNSAPSPVLRRSISALAWHNTKKSLRGLQGVSEIFIWPVLDDCVRFCWFVCVCVTDVLACPGRLACLTCPGLCMCETSVLVHVHLSICMFISCSYILAHECQNHNGSELTYGHSPSASWMAPESPVSRMPVPWSFLQTYN